MTTMTEKEARTKWCPMARVQFVGHAGNNRVSTAMIRMMEKRAEENARDLAYFREQQADCTCVASDCAMWQWHSDPAESLLRDANGHPPPARGHCGLVRLGMVIERR